LLHSFDTLVADMTPTKLGDLLPEIRTAGEDAGSLCAEAATRLGLREGTPVAPAEGDQPAALAGSLIGEAGMVSVSFGTSVCANSVGDRPFAGVSSVIDHFCAPDGKPINMVFLRNGTTFMNSVVSMLGKAAGDDVDAFARVMPKILAASPDCGGILALPFMDDEPGLGINRGGTATLVGLNAENADPGNIAKAALLSTVFNLKMGSEVLVEQRFPLKEIILSGGLTKTPELGQIIADVFRAPVTLLSSAEEGTAWGAALMAKYRSQCLSEKTEDWAEFLKRHASDDPVRFDPNSDTANELDQVYDRYVRLVQTQPHLEQAVSG
jgi:sugar (pentulose or hexulose) kinase